MFLYLTVSALDEHVNATRFKRVLKGASSLSVFGDAADGPSFSLGTDPHCSCDLHVSGPDGTGAGITLAPAAGESLVKALEAAVAGGFTPLEVRVFWANDEASRTVNVTLSEFRRLVAENSFDGRAAYAVVA